MAPRDARPQRERVTLRNPNGKFSVTVSPSRAARLRERGYTDAGPVALTGRPALIARAKELGIPAVGTNEALQAAIDEAAGASPDDD